MFTIAVDDVAEERRSGSRAFLLNHFAAGALGQRICLAATAHGLFARPLRGYDEGSANQFLGLEHRAILQVACGVGRRVNPPYDLRWR
jgi:nitroreductase